MNITEKILGERCFWWKAYQDGALTQDKALCKECNGYKIRARELKCLRYSNLPYHFSLKDKKLLN